MTFPQRGEPDDGLRIALAGAPNGVKLVEPTFLKPDQALAPLVQVRFGGDRAERQRALDCLVGFGGDGDDDTGS
jgi:hypothetical protein